MMRYARYGEDVVSMSYVLGAGLAQGTNGPDVVELQNALLKAGYSVGPAGADGFFGPDTATAVRKFQAARGIDATGAVDTITGKALGLKSYNGIPRIAIVMGVAGIGGLLAWWFFGRGK